jgi:hypothetical protein
MNPTSCDKPENANPPSTEKPGFFKRIFKKLDESMKKKADEKAQQGSCCGGSGSAKGGKCC